MKQKITTWSHPPFLRCAYLRGALIALILLTGAGLARSQTTVYWASGYPKFDNNHIVTLEDASTLRIRVAALGTAISDASIVVTLPSGVEYESGSAQADSPTGTTITTTSSASTVTLKVTSNGNTLVLNQETEFHLKVKVGTCASPASVNFVIEVQSNGSLVANGSRSILANIVQPILTLTPQSAVVNYTSQTQVQTITYYLKATTVDKASSATVSFTTPDAATTLSNFKVKGAPVTPTVAPSGSG